MILTIKVSPDGLDFDGEYQIINSNFVRSPFLALIKCVSISLSYCQIHNHYEHSICHPPVVGGDDNEKRRGMADISGLDDRRRVETDSEAGRTK